MRPRGGIAAGYSAVNAVRLVAPQLEKFVRINDYDLIPALIKVGRPHEYRWPIWNWDLEYQVAVSKGIRMSADRNHDLTRVAAVEQQLTHVTTLGIRATQLLF